MREGLLTALKHVMNESVMTSVRDPAKELEYLARACQESAEDIRAIKRGEPVNYNLDFALLCPVVFQQPGKGSKDFFLPSAPSVRRILSNAKASAFQIVISGYTMMEIFDQLAHMRHRLRTARPDLYSSVDEGVLRGQLMTSEQLRADLLQFTERGLDALTRVPVDYMRSLLDSGAIRGIGDVLDSSLIRRYADRDQLERFFAEHRAQRIRGETRDVLDSEFHYKIDAVNSCLTLAMVEAGSTPAYLVTHTPTSIRQCTVKGAHYARLDRTPLFVMNAMELGDKEHVDDEVAYLERTARRCLEYAAEIKPNRPLREAAVDTRLGAIRQLVDISKMLGRTEPIRAQDIEEDVEEITAALRDPAGMHERIAGAVMELEQGAQRLEAEAASLDLGYVSEFDFSDDPVLARVRRQLGLVS